ncbi:MAG: fluoride efflux transporter CrcB [Chloroflexaceae bacterium]|nr:fluoride efflux transporter CrcB [Chloroflexaceae bacterium]
MDKILWVGTGGFVGSVLRYLVSGYVQGMSGSIDIPYGTFAVNTIGCFVIGFLSELVEMRGVLTAEIRALLITGTLGGFTTFSTFSNETMSLMRDGQTPLALLNIGASVAAGLVAVWLGYSLAYAIWR